MHIIGFAGTAKNTGKTTSALHVLGLCRQAGYLPALTSIGYDGENLDTITGLPKPRYHLLKGELVATAQSCLRGGSAMLRTLHSTGNQTTLGEVIIARVIEAGTAILAGPNRKADLLPVLAEFNRFGADISIVDGALNRCVPLSVADGILFATGAALDNRFPILAGHTAALAALFSLPAFIQEGAQLLPSNSIHIIHKDYSAISTGNGSVLAHGTARAAASLIQPGCRRIIIPGACRPEYLATLLETAGSHLGGSDLVLSGPLKLLAGAGPLEWSPVLDAAHNAGCQVKCLEPVALRLITVNPFYPAYSAGQNSYSAAYVDAAALLEAVESAVANLPVIDVFQPHEDNILKIFGITDNGNMPARQHVEVDL